MIQVSLDSEPPPICKGQKEVKKKSKNLPQMVFSSKDKNTKSELKYENNKKLEDKIKNNSKNSSSTEDYSSLENYFSEEKITSSQENIRFLKKSFSDGNLSPSDINYLDRNKENPEENKTNSNFYLKNTEYKFNFSQTFIKGDDKEKKYYSESKEKQEKEQTYTLFSFEDEKTTEENTIKWIATAYN